METWRPEAYPAGMPHLEEAGRVRSYEVDADGYLSPVSIFNLMQNAASNHADALGISIHDLMAENRTWVLSRFVLGMDRYPGWKDPVKVVTWPSGVEKLFALRDFELLDGAGRLLGAALSGWLILDMRTRRPLRIEPFVGRLNPIQGRHALKAALGKLPPLERAEGRVRFGVRHSDLDVNRHTNSAAYIVWALEAIPLDRKDLGRLDRLEINFLGETFSGDEVDSLCQLISTDPPGCLHSIRRSDGQEVARAVTSWKGGSGQGSGH